MGSGKLPNGNQCHGCDGKGWVEVGKSDYSPVYPDFPWIFPPYYPSFYVTYYTNSSSC